jgi:hypothetical protein
MTPEQFLERTDGTLRALVRRELTFNSQPRFNFAPFTLFTVSVVFLAILIATKAPDGPGGAIYAAEAVFVGIHYGLLLFIWSCLPLWAANSIVAELTSNSLDDLFVTPVRLSDVFLAKLAKPALYSGLVYLMLMAVAAPFYAAANTPLWPHVESLLTLLVSVACAVSIGYWSAFRPLSRPAMVLQTYGATLAVLALPALFHWTTLAIEHGLDNRESLVPSWKSVWLLHPWEGWGRPLPLILDLVYLSAVAAAFHRLTRNAHQRSRDTELPRSEYQSFTRYSASETYLNPATCLFYYASPFSRSGVILVLALIGLAAGLCSRASLHPPWTGTLWFLDVDYLVALIVLFSVGLSAHLVGQSEVTDDLKVTLLPRRELFKGRYWATVLLTMPFVATLVAGCQLKLLYMYFHSGEIQTSTDILGYECFVGTYITLALYVCLIGCDRIKEKRHGQMSSPSSLLSVIGVFQGEHILVRLVYQFASERWIADALRLGIYSGTILLLLPIVLRLDYVNELEHRYENQQ